MDVGGAGEAFAKFLAQVVEEAERRGHVADALGARLRHQALPQRQLAVGHEHHATVRAIRLAVGRLAVAAHRASRRVSHKVINLRKTQLRAFNRLTVTFKVQILNAF